MDDVLSTDASSTSDHFAGAFAFAAIPARYTLERRQWAEAAKLGFVPQDLAWDKFPRPSPSRGSPGASGAARSGDVARGPEGSRAASPPCATPLTAGQERVLGRAERDPAARGGGVDRAGRGQEGGGARPHAAVGRPRGRHREAPGHSRRALPRAGDARATCSSSSGQPAAALAEIERLRRTTRTGSSGCAAPGARRARRQPGEGSAVLRAAPDLAKAADGERMEIKQARAFLGR